MFVEIWSILARGWLSVAHGCFAMVAMVDLEIRRIDPRWFDVVDLRHGVLSRPQWTRLMKADPEIATAYTELACDGAWRIGSMNSSINFPENATAPLNPLRKHGDVHHSIRLRSGDDRMRFRSGDGRMRFFPVQT